MQLGRRLAGLAAAALLAAAAWGAYASYAAFANVAGWTGIAALGWLRPWLTEFRTPLLCVALFLVLTAVSRLWEKLKLGH